MSSVYDIIAGSFERSYTEKALSMFDVARGEHFLEIGFGTGEAIVKLARSVGVEGRVSGIDIADRMVEITRARVRRHQLSGRVELKRGDALDLPYESSVFDGIFMSFTLELFDTPDIHRLLDECRRVLEPDGRICVLSLSNRYGIHGPARLYTALHLVFPSVLDCRPIPAGRLLEEHRFSNERRSYDRRLGFAIEICLARKGPERRNTPGTEHGYSNQTDI